MSISVSNPLRVHCHRVGHPAHPRLPGLRPVWEDTDWKPPGCCIHQQFPVLYNKPMQWSHVCPAPSHCGPLCCHPVLSVGNVGVVVFFLYLWISFTDYVISDQLLQKYLLCLIDWLTDGIISCILKKNLYDLFYLPCVIIIQYRFRATAWIEDAEIMSSIFYWI